MSNVYISRFIILVGLALTISVMPHIAPSGFEESSSYDGARREYSKYDNGGNNPGWMMEAREKNRRNQLQTQRDRKKALIAKKAGYQKLSEEIKDLKNRLPDLRADKSQCEALLKQAEKSVREIQKKLMNDSLSEEETKSFSGKHLAMQKHALRLREELAAVNTRIATINHEVEAREKLQTDLQEKFGKDQLSEAEKQEYEQRVLRIQNQIDNVDQIISKIEDASALGMAVTRGIAGNDWKAIQDLDVYSVTDGIKAGMLFKGSRVIGDKLEDTIKNEVGGIWDTLVASPLRVVKRHVKKFWNLVVNKGRSPFELHTLEAWKAEVLDGVIDGLEKYGKEAERNQSTGRSARMRSFSADLENFGESEERLPRDIVSDPMQDVMANDTQWHRMARGYGSDLERISKRIQAHKVYYARSAEDFSTEEADIVALATRIQEILADLREKIILPADSLKDLAEGDNKLFLPQVAKDLRRRFDLLINAVQMYHGYQKKGMSQTKSSDSSRKSSRYGYGDPMF